MLIPYAHSRSAFMPLTLVILFCSFLAPVDTRAQAAYIEASVLTVYGDVQLISSSRPGVFALAPKHKLEPGNEIVTGGNGRVVIDLTDGSQVIVLPKSRVRLKEFRSANSVRELLYIIVGRVRVKVHHAGGIPNPYRLNSPAASIAVRGTDFIVDVLVSGETSVFVYEGLVEVSSLINPGNKRLVAPGDRVIVRPGGDISMALPGPGGELNGQSRLYKDVSQIYQQSINSLVQNSTEISPAFFSAFPDPHLDSIENPAYAAEFTTAQGRLSLLPSVRRPDSLILSQTLKQEYDFRQGERPARFDYSIAPQLTFFTPIPGTRLTLGAGVSAARTNLSDLLRYEYSFDQFYSSHEYNVASLNVLNLSTIAAYSLGDTNRTSIGIGLDHLSGNGSLHYISESVAGESALDNIISSKARLARTRLSLGFAHEFSGGRKLGLYFRNGLSSSDQEYEQRLITGKGDFPWIENYVLPIDKMYVSTVSSEIGFRWRAPLTRRLSYGFEGSYLREKIDSRSSLINKTVEEERDRAQRARFGGGLGYILKSTTVFNLDLAGGFYKTTKPEFIGGILSIPHYYLYPQYRSDSERGIFLSAHAAMQTKLWRNSFASASYLIAFRQNYLHYKYDWSPYDKDSNKFATIGLGWKFKPNLVAQYLISLEHTPYTRRVPSHTLMLRYTFDLKITNEK
ncbi:MAG: FecR family protein [Acidobacteria bacterium]|nr:FecR family protein [Acidobacteriota bacterium]